MSGRRFALVTGASSGIGRELARTFATAGYDLAICAEDERITDVAAQLSALGADVTPVLADLSEPDGVERFHRAATAAGRPVDVAAINAGIGVGGPFSATELADDLRLVDLNVRSSVHLAKLAVRGMVARGSGGSCSPRRSP